MTRTWVICSAVAALCASASVAFAQEEDEADDLDEMDELDDLDDLDELDEIPGAGSGGPLFRLSKGFVATEVRAYVAERDAIGNEEQLVGELRVDIDLGFSARWSGYVRPWFLIDALDTDLHRYEPLDGYVQYKRERWDLRVGQFVESWGMADTFNPVDVLNRRDPAADFFDPVSLGEAGVKFRYATSLGETVDQIAVSAYAMPLWRETPFPTENSRFGISADMATIRTDLTERPALEDAFFGAVRVEHTLATGVANADLQYVVARGPDRTPVFTPVPQMDGTFDLIPQYHGSWVYGAGIRAVPNAAGWSKLSLKAEVAHKRPFSLDSVEGLVADPYTQFALGIERSFHRIVSTKDELIALAEYIGDVGADDQPSDLRPFDSEVAVALRWARNDFARTTADVRVIVDVSSGDLIGELVTERDLRFVHNDLRLTVSGRWIRVGNDEASVFALLPDNSSVTTRLQFSF